ncbi:MAG: nucleotide exchange factor GrpE [Kiritimatiellae bacterium]|nr:nucleotide exchange factor GrpE [Kiritimatiellia bacterium]
MPDEEDIAKNAANDGAEQENAAPGDTIVEPRAEEAGEAAPADGEAGEPGAAGGNPEAAADKPGQAALEAALAAEKDRAVRLYADFENFRRRMERERLETWGRAERDVLAGLLPVIDNFDRAMAQAGDDPFSEGVRMVYASMADFLKKHGVEPVVAVGTAFDPAIHEAVAYQPSPEAPEGIVIYETRKGYRIGDGVLRPASVIVSSGAPAQ